MYERLTDRARKTLELALREALQLGHNYIGTEHILLGLIREGEGVAAQTLVNDLGLSLSGVRQAVIQRLGGYGRDVECPACGKGIEAGHTPDGRKACMRELRRRQVEGQDHA